MREAQGACSYWIIGVLGEELEGGALFCVAAVYGGSKGAHKEGEY
jgi:hypothetical protein